MQTNTALESQINELKTEKFAINSARECAPWTLARGSAMEREKCPGKSEAVSAGHHYKDSQNSGWDKNESER